MFNAHTQHTHLVGCARLQNAADKVRVRVAPLVYARDGAGRQSHFGLRSHAYIREPFDDSIAATDDTSQAASRA